MWHKVCTSITMPKSVPSNESRVAFPDASSFFNDQKVPKKSQGFKTCFTTLTAT